MTPEQERAAGARWCRTEARRCRREAWSASGTRQWRALRRSARKYLQRAEELERAPVQRPHPGNEQIIYRAPGGRHVAIYGALYRIGPSAWLAVESLTGEHHYFLELISPPPDTQP